MGNFLVKSSIELKLRKCRTNGLRNKKPYGEALSDGVPEEIALMLLFLFRWHPKAARLTPPYLQQLLEAEDVKLYLFTGVICKTFLFYPDRRNLIAKYHDPSPIYLTVMYYLKSLPEPLLIPERQWHYLGHDIAEDSIGYHPEQMAEAQCMLRNMPETHRKLLAMVLLVVRQACEDDAEFVIENDLHKLCKDLGPALCHRTRSSLCLICSRSERNKFVVAQRLARFLVRWRSADDRFPFAPVWSKPVREEMTPPQP